MPVKVMLTTPCPLAWLWALPCPAETWRSLEERSAILSDFEVLDLVTAADELEKKKKADIARSGNADAKETPKNVGTVL